MTTVGILHPGEMGAAVGRSLVDGGHHVLWSGAGRTEPTRRRAAEAGMEDAGSLAELAERCGVILSICPPHAALEVAQAVAGFSGVYVDANAIAPETARRVCEVIGEGYVDGSIIGPPPREAAGTRLYLAGPQANEVAALFAGGGTEARVLEAAGRTAASALKMSYAAWTKGSAALLIASADLAAALGVGEALAGEWAQSQPGLAERLLAAQASAATKGWRWEGEMREIAKTFADVGLPNGFHDGAAEIYAREPRPEGG